MKVSKKCCGQCLFTSNKIVSDKRRNQIIKDCVSNQSYFICHKATIAGDDVCCRGFYEKFGEQSQMIRVSERLNCVKFVDVEARP